jgi:diadenosine tetraphosphate (Ap4A) HIT family hydrolase
MTEFRTKEDLRDFLLRRMRMSHVYQPVMLKLLLLGGGKASIRDIARAFLALDEAQLEYYEEITKRMPGPVLARHGWVERNGEEYRLSLPLDSLSSAERSELIEICDAKLRDYIEKRGAGVYDHRRTALGEISGTVRYEVLKAARFRCELCGVSAEEAALQVDHIIPRKHGGMDLIENLQALCWQCNANKGDRDATDFRAVRAEMDAKQTDCPFCSLVSGRVLMRNTLAVAFRDAYPVTALHTLVAPRRHTESWFDMSIPEQRAVNLLVSDIRDEIASADKSVDGFNLGVNVGTAAGQTVFHTHVHVIPRRQGDVANPKGGIRGVIPSRQQY